MDSHSSHPKKPDPYFGLSLGSTEIAQKAGISLRQLYHWVDALHVAHPQLQTHGSRSFRRFSIQDLARLKRMKELVLKGYTPHAASELAMKPDYPNRSTG